MGTKCVVNEWMAYKWLVKENVNGILYITCCISMKKVAALIITSASWTGLPRGWLSSYTFILTSLPRAYNGRRIYQYKRKRLSISFFYFYQAGAYSGICPGGRLSSQHPLGHENPLKSIWFHWSRGGGLALIGLPPEYASAPKLSKQRKLCKLVIWNKLILKGLISSDSPCKERKAGFTMVPLKPLCVRLVHR